MAAEQKPAKQYHYGTGRRKTAIARVRLYANGSGKITVNDKTITPSTETYLDPLKLVGQYGNTDLTVKVNGGGTVGQLDAIRHGIARALVELDEAFKTTLKKAGYLTRDPRERERKKPGLKSARRSSQWSKR
jgi:small subunit ribosomal protein S9